MNWVEMLVFCVVFHAVSYLFKSVDQHRRDVALQRALRELSLQSEKIDEGLRRIK